MTRLRTSAWPIVSWRRLAPITATERGLKNRWIEAASAWCSRLDMAPTRVSVGSIGNSRLSTPSSYCADDPVAGVPEGLDHRLVVREHLGDEPVEAALAGRLGEVLEQDLGDPAALVLVLDEERDLGLARLHDVVAADRDHPALEQDHEGDPVHVVDLGEPGHVALGERRHRGEEPVVLRLVGDPGVELDQQVLVLGPDRPDVRRAAVLQQDVGLPVKGRGLGGAHGRDSIGGS